MRRKINVKLLYFIKMWRQKESMLGIMIDRLLQVSVGNQSIIKSVNIKLNEKQDESVKRSRDRNKNKSCLSDAEGDEAVRKRMRRPLLESTCHCSKVSTFRSSV